MKVKIIETYGHDYCDDDYCRKIYNIENITDWEDVDEEELAALILWANTENKRAYNDKKLVVITEKMLDYKKTIAEYLQKARDIKNELIEKERKRKEAEEKRLIKLEKLRKQREEKEREKKLAKLEKLKKELNV